MISNQKAINSLILMAIITILGLLVVMSSFLVIGLGGAVVSALVYGLVGITVLVFFLIYKEKLELDERIEHGLKEKPKTAPKKGRKKK